MWMYFSTGIFAPVHKISKVNNSNGNSQAVVGKKPVKQLSERKRDSPTNTLERNKTSLTDVQVCLFSIAIVYRMVQNLMENFDESGLGNFDK